MSEDEFEFDENKTKFRDSFAFSDYKYGPKIVKRSWVLIILTGFLAALISFGIGLLSSLYGSSQWWINLLSSLVGLPLGFLIAWKNSYETLLQDIYDAIITALIYALTYLIIGLIIIFVLSTRSVFSVIFGLFSFWGSALLIGFYSICIFVMGAVLWNIYEALLVTSN